MAHPVDRWLSRALTLCLSWLVAGFVVFISVWQLFLREAWGGDSPHPGQFLLYGIAVIPAVVLMPLLLLLLYAVSRTPHYRAVAILLGICAALANTVLVLGAGFPGIQLAYLGFAATVPRAPKRSRAHSGEH